MPVKVGDRYWRPDLTYDIELIIKDQDYSNEINSVRIISSLSTVYQIIYLELFVPVDDIILENGLSEEDKLKLNIKLSALDPSLKENINLDLLVIDFSCELPPLAQDNSSSKQADRTSILLTTIIKDSFNSMTTLINDFYEEKTVKQVIEDLANKVGVKIEYDTEDENTEVIDQIIVPPLTLNRAIYYLDEVFGLFNGITSVFCQYDNTLQIKNLTKQMNKNQKIKIDLLTNDGDNTEIIEKSEDGENFYTYTPIVFETSANTNFSLLSKNLKYIVKPKDSLYNLIEFDLNDICFKYGLIYKNKKISINSDLNRTKYYTDQMGYEDTESFAISSISKKISNLSSLNIELSGNLPITNLMKVGEVVKFDTKVLEFLKLTGKYILFVSDILFTKTKEWENSVNLTIKRTNKNMN